MGTALERRRQPAGFTLIEVLLAMAILATILLGLLPLFTRAMADNAAGQEAGQQANLGRSQLEEMLQLPFNHLRLEVQAGTESTAQRFYASGTEAEGDEAWTPTADPPGETVYWRRDTTVRQYSVLGVQDTDGDGVVDVIRGIEDADRDGLLDNPLPAGALPGSIHVKEVDVTLQSLRADGGLVRGTPPLRLRSYKAF